MAIVAVEIFLIAASSVGTNIIFSYEKSPGVIASQ